MPYTVGMMVRKTALLILVNTMYLVTWSGNFLDLFIADLVQEVTGPT